MAYLLLLYAIISFLCCWSGLLFYEISDRFSGEQDHSYRRPLIGHLLSGLMLITALGQWLVLFLPLGFLSLLIVLLILIVLSFPFRKKIFLRARNILAEIKNRDIFFSLCLAVFLIMILVLNAGPTIMDDTESYHIQMIKWVQEYGTVPGIANLHLRFGFNSSWFIAVALLSPKLKGVDHYLALNGLLSCWLCYYLLDKIFSISSKDCPLS
jgi:hypothetical protein